VERLLDATGHGIRRRSILAAVRNGLNHPVPEELSTSTCVKRPNWVRTEESPANSSPGYRKMISRSGVKLFPRIQKVVDEHATLIHRSRDVAEFLTIEECTKRDHKHDKSRQLAGRASLRVQLRNGIRRDPPLSTRVCFVICCAGFFCWPCAPRVSHH
jgi:hypothetical protein